MAPQQKWIFGFAKDAPRLARLSPLSSTPVKPFSETLMPRHNDKDNDSRGRRERPDSRTGRSGKPRGSEQKFAKRGFGANKFDAGGNKPRFRREREDRPFRRREGEEAPRRFERDERRPKRVDRDARPAGRVQDRKFRERREEGEFKGRREGRSVEARDRSNEKPWQKRDDRRR